MGLAHSFCLLYFVRVCIIHIAMSKVLAVDLDGTLFYPRKVKRCISKKNVHFLRNWIDAGNRLVIVTSRCHEFTIRLKDEIQRPFDSINCSGAQMYHNDDLIYEKSMKNADIANMINKIKKRYHPSAMFVTTDEYPNVIYRSSGLSRISVFFYRMWYFFQFKYREPSVISNDLFKEQLSKGKIYKAMIFYGFGKRKGTLSKEINKELRENFPDMESSWSSIVNELTPNHCNKGESIEKYCQLLNVDPKDVYVVGDSGNDIAMFNRFHENSYCMSHAYPSVKKYAKHVISRVHKLDKIVLKGEK